MAFGYTYTYPTITGSHSDFNVLLKTVDFPSAAIDGTVNAIDNGGGDLRDYTDSSKSTQSSVEIINFVSSGLPEGEVWIKAPTVATNLTTFVEADAVATTQPAVGAPFGRNSVWSESEVVFDIGGTVAQTDATGNGFTVTTTNLPVVSSDSPFGVGTSIDFDTNSARYNLSSNPIGGVSACNISGWFKMAVGKTQAGLIGAFNGNSDMSFLFWVNISGNLMLRMKTGGVVNTDINTGAYPANVWTMYHINYDGSTITVYLDGVDSGSTSGTGTIDTTTSTFMIGSGGDGFTQNWEGLQKRFNVKLSSRTSNFIATEFDNQSSVSSWGAVGAWTEPSVGATIPVIMNSYRQRRT